MCVVLDDIGFETLSLHGGGGAEVGFDGGISFTAFESFSGEFVEGDLDVRVEESEESLRVFVEEVTDVVWEVLLDDCPNEHDTSEN